MPRLSVTAICVLLAITTLARAEEKYTLREQAEVNRATHFEVTYDSTSKSDTSEDGKVDPDEHTDSHHYDILKGTATVLEVKDGSATAMKVEIDPGSYSSDEEKGKDKVKKPSPFAGKTITLRRREDDSVGNDFKENATKDQLHDLNSLLDPDEDNYPDHPVAVGESWEISDKVAKRIDLGPKDQVLAHCRLDSVSTENGKQIAQISVSAAFVTFEDRFVETDIELSGILKVDLANGQVLRGDLKGPLKISGSDTLANADGGKPQKIEITGDGEVTTLTVNTPSTKPSK